MGPRLYLPEQQRSGTGPRAPGVSGFHLWLQKPSLFFWVSGSCATLAVASSANILPMLSAGLGVNSLGEFHSLLGSGLRFSLGASRQERRTFIQMRGNRAFWTEMVMASVADLRPGLPGLAD